MVWRNRLGTVMAMVAGLVLLVALALHACYVFRCMHNLGELQNLRPRDHLAQPQGHALVLGASWTGMLAAAVLAPYVTRVTVLERDEALALDAPNARRGVPHGSQSHVFVHFAMAFVNALLPDFEAALARAGGKTGGDMGLDFRWHHRGRWRLTQPLGLPMWFASRPLVERIVRQTVLKKHANVAIRSGVTVCKLLAGSAPHQLSGVELTHATSVTEKVAADLVVDCMGKNSHAARWLAALGWPGVPLSLVHAATFYVSRRFVKANQSAHADGVLAWHGHHRMGKGGQFAGATTIEDGLMSVWGVQAGLPLGTTDTAFERFFANTGVPQLAAHVQAAPVGPLRAFGAGPSRRLRWSGRHLPDNFVVLGDAVCCTNPVYGLGLALAASTVACLATELRQRAKEVGGAHWRMQGLGRQVAQRVALRTFGPWLLTTCEEYRLPHTCGPHKDRIWVRLLQWYVDRAFAMAHDDAAVDKLVLQVVSLMAHPLKVFSPRLLFKVLSPSWFW